MRETYTPERVLDLWFPEDGHWTSPESHGAFWQTRMYGGMDEVICRDFAGLTRAAAAGELDHWAATPRGRLALLIALDQFPRSLWRGTPAAYAQDCKAARLAMEGIRNGDFSQLRPWEQMFFVIALGHCEGPDHLDRLDLIDRVTKEIAAGLPPEIAEMAERLCGQNARVRAVIERFGRHPHRNPVYGRVSSAEEEAYIATGDFPHVKKEAAPT
jgi:uncharacterized protein (DUF924 family)